MCGGTWPPKRCEPSTKTGKRISLDGAADLIDAAVSLPRRFRVSYLITTRGPEGLRLWGKRNNLGRPTPAKRRIVTSSVEQSSVLNYYPALSSGEFTSPSPRGRAPKLPGEQQTQCGKIIGKVLLLGPGQREHRKARLG